MRRNRRKGGVYRNERLDLTRNGSNQLDLFRSVTFGLLWFGLITFCCSPCVIHCATFHWSHWARELMPFCCHTLLQMIAGIQLITSCGHFCCFFSIFFFKFAGFLLDSPNYNGNIFGNNCQSSKWICNRLKLQQKLTHKFQYMGLNKWQSRCGNHNK